MYRLSTHMYDIKNAPILQECPVICFATKAIFHLTSLSLVFLHSSHSTKFFITIDSNNRFCWECRRCSNLSVHLSNTLSLTFSFQVRSVSFVFLRFSSIISQLSCVILQVSFFVSHLIFRDPVGGCSSKKLNLNASLLLFVVFHLNDFFVPTVATITHEMYI